MLESELADLNDALAELESMEVSPSYDSTCPWCKQNAVVFTDPLDKENWECDLCCATYASDKHSMQCCKTSYSTKHVCKTCLGACMSSVRVVIVLD